MSPRLLALLPLLLLAPACTVVHNDTPNGTTSLSVQGLYRKPATGATRPTRYCWAEVYDLNAGTVAADGYLDGNGQRAFTVPAGIPLQVRIYARVEVPGTAPDFTLRGSVKNAALPASFTDTNTFNALQDVSVTSDAGSGSSVSVTAEADAQQRAGAFNAVDQMVAFGNGMHALEPSLKLPNLHAFFTSTGNGTAYPILAYDGTSHPLVQASGRAVFTLPIAGNASGAASTNNDLGDDAVLLEAYSHLLTADRSYPADGSGPGSILRRDNDDAWVDRDVQSEPTIAFTDGFCDFLVGAFRALDRASAPERITDTYVASNGSAAISTFDLSRHDQFTRVAGQGEFYRGSVAISLWQIWHNYALGGGTTLGIQALWGATLRNQSGEYLNAPLGAYPTYLVGLRSLLGASSPGWSAALFELSQEDVPNPDAAYFAGNTLWIQEPVLPFTATGSLVAYAPSANLYYDRNQAATYRFVHGGGPRTLQVTPTGGQDVFLELIGPAGVVAQSLNSQGVGARTLSFTTLAAGTYGVRVRVGYTTANATASYTLTVN